MKTTNFGLINIMNELDSFNSKKLPQRISYAIIRTHMNAMKEYSFYEEGLKNLINSYGDFAKKDGDGNIVIGKSGIPIIEGEKSKEFVSELNDLLNIEVDLEIKYVDMEAFDYEDSDKYDALSPQEIIALQSIICVDL